MAASWNRQAVSNYARGFRGPRVPVEAIDRRDAVARARSKPWWPRVNQRAPIVNEHGRWWFVLLPEGAR